MRKQIRNIIFVCQILLNSIKLICNVDLIVIRLERYFLPIRSNLDTMGAQQSQITAPSPELRARESLGDADPVHVQGHGEENEDDVQDPVEFNVVESLDASEWKRCIAVDDDAANEVRDEKIDDSDNVVEVGARQGLSGVGVARSQEVVVVPHADDGGEKEDGVGE